MAALAPLTTGELEDLVAGLLMWPDVWRDSVVAPDPGERTYARIMGTERVEIWAVSWMDGQDTGFHDHDDAAAAIAVVEGAVVDSRLALGGAPITHRHEAGALFTVAPAAIHRVHHVGDGPALTLHAYSPPLQRMGTYEVTGNGELLRHARGGEERLEATAQR